MFLGVFVGSKGKVVLGAGIRPSFCRVLIRARKVIVLMLYIEEWMDQTGEELKRARGCQESSSNR